MTGGLDIEVTYATILAAARNGEVTSYKKLAEAHGRELEDVGGELFGNLGNILRVCFKRGWPALTVIVVNEKTGALTGKELLGFAVMAETVGYKFEKNAHKFATVQFDLVFRWASYAPEKLEPKHDEIRRLPTRTVWYRDEWEPHQPGVT